MTDELEGLDAKLLRGMLPALYKKAQEGDQRAVDTVLRILQRLEKNAPPPVPSDPAEPGFTAPINVPGQLQSRASRKEFEVLLENPPTDDPFTNEGILQLSEAYFRMILVHPQKLDQFLASFEMRNSQLSFLGLSPATDAEWLEWIGELAAEEQNRLEQSK